jgi:predicted Zn-dependent protease with MMP-like domain
MRFESLLYKAVDALPLEFKNKMENVDIVVEDWPSKQQLKRMKLRNPGQLLGLYEGIPQIHRGQGYSLVLPDKITIFQKPIEQQCNTEQQIETEVGNVVRHEIAHHFGLTDAALHDIERQKNIRNK